MCGTIIQAQNPNNGPSAHEISWLRSLRTVKWMAWDVFPRIPYDQLMVRFTIMANGLHEDGWFTSNDISLYHIDLEPRTIFIYPSKDTVQPTISGVLDWDIAALVPSFMSWVSPLWIWAVADGEEEDERTANDVPPTEEGNRLKMFLKKLLERNLYLMRTRRLIG